MNADALAALKASIRKWDKNGRVRSLKNAKLGSDNCPLCDLFLFIENQCEDCPVMQATTKPFCRDTPYYGVRSAYYRNDLSAFHAAARAEAAFLRTLLPEGETA